MKSITEILKSIRMDEDFDSSDDFIVDGLIDSADLQRLIAAIEEEYGVKLAGTDLMPQNFSDKEAIRDMLGNYDIDAPL